MTMRRTIVATLRFLHLNKIAHKVYYRYIQGFEAQHKAILEAIDRCFLKIAEDGSKPHGDYMEFGIFKGYSFWYAQRSAGQHDLDTMRFFGFDSFKGLPAPSSIDETKNNVFYEGQYYCDRADVVKNLNFKGVDWKKTYLIEGFFDVSLVQGLKKKYDMKRVKIALIDCDLYDSTKSVMDFLEDLIEENTILLFDDWDCFGDDESRGQRRAAKEFLERVPTWSFEGFFSYGEYGQVFIVRRR